MNLLLTADTAGGVWTYAVELVGALRDLAPEVHVFLATLGGLPSQTQRAEIAALLPSSRLFHSDARLEWMDDPWEDVHRSGAWLTQVARDVNADLIHLNHGFAHAADLPWTAPVLLVGHSCAGSWWRAVRGEETPARWDEYRARVRAGLNAASLVAAPSAALVHEWRALYGFQRADACVLSNGRGPHPELVPGEKKEPLVLAAGRLWDEAKNIAALVRVAPRLPWSVEVAGDVASPDGRPFTAAPGGVRLPGKLSADALAARMRAAAIFAAPARYEPFGLAILEAALCGCALVLGDIPSLRELWDGAAVFVDPADDHALTETLVSLAEDPEHRRVLTDAALLRARPRTAVRMATAYVDVYRALTPHAGWVLS